MWSGDFIDQDCLHSVIDASYQQPSGQDGTMWKPYLYGFKLKPIPKLKDTVPPRKDDRSDHPRLRLKLHCPLSLICHAPHVKDLLPILIANFNQAHHFCFRPGCYDITFTLDPKYVKSGCLSHSSGSHKSPETTRH